MHTGDTAVTTLNYALIWISNLLPLAVAVFALIRAGQAETWAAVLIRTAGVLLVLRTLLFASFMLLSQSEAVVRLAVVWDVASMLATIGAMVLLLVALAFGRPRRPVPAPRAPAHPPR
ncbi:hypothetical protein [Streptomonospora nanhaiensis]|uniref:Uncharacterized protein n=1 Tax=Streptomonospora nanhaiensis TaxID=1323731 RepID=A0A853BRV4_9ACTN|nr:hypothetical protein [Streptomonospora nanhaiensis]MBV2363814.1 hypothetical protein [Streptomonospora nanhaiensis]NYI97604.1 hypothetical protein [Streptomonospora nanhaiensis]